MENERTLTAAFISGNEQGLTDGVREQACVHGTEGASTWVSLTSGSSAASSSMTAMLRTHATRPAINSNPYGIGVSSFAPGTEYTAQSLSVC